MSAARPWPSAGPGSTWTTRCHYTSTPSQVIHSKLFLVASCQQREMQRTTNFVKAAPGNISHTESL